MLVKLCGSPRPCRMADDIVASNLFPADIYPEPVVGADHSPYFRACDSNGLQNTLKWTDFTFSKAKTATFTVSPFPVFFGSALFG